METEDYFSVTHSLSGSTETYDEKDESGLPNDLMKWLLPFEIIIGVILSIVALVILIRRRLWLQHEGYVYVGAILILNIVILTFDFGSISISTFNYRYDINDVSDITCKVWSFFFTGYSAINWLVIAFLLNICIRSWTEKSFETGLPKHSYCTNRGSMIVCVIVVVVTLLINSWKLFTFELESNSKYQNGSHNYYCAISDQSNDNTIYMMLFAYVIIYGLPVIFALPILFDLIACTGYNIGSDSSEHFPRGTLVAFGGFTYLMLYPLEGSRLQFYWLSNIVVQMLILTEAFVLMILAILCLTAMPKLRNEIKEKLGSICSKRHRQTYEVESAELEESVKEK